MGTPTSGQNISSRLAETPTPSGAHGRKVDVADSSAPVVASTATMRSGKTPALKNGRSSAGTVTVNCSRSPRRTLPRSSSAPKTVDVSGGLAAASVMALRVMNAVVPTSSRIDDRQSIVRFATKVPLARTVVPG